MAKKKTLGTEPLPAWLTTDGTGFPSGLPVDKGLANVNFRLALGQGRLTGEGDLTATGHAIKWSKADLTGVGIMQATGRLDCTGEVNLAHVDWSPLYADLCPQAVERLLYQFRNSPVLVQLVCTLNAQIQEAYDVTLDVMRKCEISTAQGVQLDVIGRRVGCTRQPSSLSDEAYRYRLVAKIFKNHVLYSSETEIQNFFYTALGRKVSVVTVAPMVCDLYVSACVGVDILRELTTFTDNPQCDGVSSPPYAATLSLRRVIVLPTGGAFMSDVGGGHQVDVGRAAVISGVTI